MTNSNHSYFGYLCAAFVLIFAITSSPVSARVADFVGTWEALNQNAGETSTIIVTRNRFGVDVRVFGICQQQECDWGTVSGDIFASGPGRNQ
ncbi:MAG: hypothetical protein V3S07_09725, partial [Micropepsaceae bacterium]